MQSRSKFPNNHFIQSVQKQPDAELSQVFSGEYCKMFKNSIFIEKLR